MQTYPQYTQWWNEQVNLIRRTSGLAALPIAEIQEEKPMIEGIADFAEESQEPKTTKCEYCHKPLKSDKRQARAIHLRYCEAYKAVDDAPKKNGATHAPAPAFADSGAVILTPEQTSKLWQAITGGRLDITVEAGQPVCRVSLDSFNKALPVLLERL